MEYVPPHEKTKFLHMQNKGPDQLCSNCTADQRLCICYSDSTIHLLLIAQISSLWPASVTVQADLCWTCLETTFVGFSTRQLKCNKCNVYSCLTSFLEVQDHLTKHRDGKPSCKTSKCIQMRWNTFQDGWQ